MPGKPKPAPKGGKKMSTSASSGFSAEEKAAMKDRAEELKSAAAGADGLKAVLAKIASFQEPDRAMAKRVHEIVLKAAPQLVPRTFYGMPAYAKDGKVVCFFQSGIKFKTRYCTLGFQDSAKLDDGAMWPTGFAIAKLTSAEEARIAQLVKKAVGAG